MAFIFHLFLYLYLDFIYNIGEKTKNIRFGQIIATNSLIFCLSEIIIKTIIIT